MSTILIILILLILLVKLEGPLYEGGPIWRIQLANAAIFKDSAAMPQSSATAQNQKK